MYDRLKAHGAEILQQGISKTSIENIQQIASDAFDSDEELAFMVAENPEIATGVNSWAAFIGSWVPHVTSQGSINNGELTKVVSMCMVQLAAVAFEAGYHAGKMRAPVTEDEVQALFGQKETDNG